MALTATMVLGDCLEVMPNMTGIGATLTVADLPYRCTRCEWDQSEIDLDGFWRGVDGISTGQYVAACFANWRFGGVLCQSNPKRFRYDMVWRKTNITGFFLAKHQPLRSHEFVLIFGPGRTYNPQMVPVGPENSYHPNVVYGTTSRSRIYGGKGKQPHRQDTGLRYPRSVQTVPSERRQNSLHPTQKPVRLVDSLVRTYSNPGDVVLDPVSGSGTTAVSALRNERSVVCIERDPNYFEVGLRRLEEMVARERIDAEIVAQR